MATLAGPNYPAVAESLLNDPDPEGSVWNDPELAEEEDGEPTAALLPVGNHSRSLLLTDFGFQIPEGMWVANFLLEVKRQTGCEYALQDYYLAGVVLVHDYGEPEGFVSKDRSDGNVWWPSDYVWTSFGGESEPADSWFDDPVSAAIVNSSSFGVRLRAKNTAGEVAMYAEIDAVRLTAWYYEPAGGGLLSMLRTIGVPHTPGYNLLRK